MIEKKIRIYQFLYDLGRIKLEDIPKEIRGKIKTK